MIYEYAPALPKKKEKLLCTFFLLLGCALFLGSMLPGLTMPWILQLLSFGFFVAFVMIFSLCIMRSYVYTVEEGRGASPDFIITEHYGRRRTVVCRVSVDSVRSIAKDTRDTRKNGDRTERKLKRFVYTGTLFDVPRYLVRIDEAGEALLLCICADEALLRILERR